mgnify:CR=1 FL=1
MGIARGPNIIKDNLVFGYDTGYGVADNSTATRFYAGKNVDNEFYNSGANGNILDYSSGYGGIGTAQSGVLDASGTTENTVYRKTGKIRFGPTGGQDIGTLVNGNTYTFSIYLRHVTGQTQGGSMEFDIVDQSNGGTNFTGTLGSNMTYEWKRFSVTSTHTNSSNYHFIDIGTYQGTNVFEWCMPQIEQGTVMSPFTNTERTSTQSLIDLKRTTSIDVSNVSFDSTGQPTFDGTDDYLLTPFTRGTLGDQLTMIAYYKFDGNTSRTYTPVFGGMESGAGTEFFIGKNSGNTHIGVQDGNYIGAFVQGSNAWDGNYHQIVYTYSNGSGKIYLDGVLKNTGTFTKCNSAEQITVGREAEGSGYWFIGDITRACVYSKVFTAEEVLKDFNAYKNRFNI